MSLTAAVITVSDKCSQGLATDTSGPALKALLSSNSWLVARTELVPDNKRLIASTAQRLSAECNLIVVSGGTGVSPSDVTVEALEPLFTKRLPSLAIAMVVGSLAITPMAALSQVTAGVINRSIVVAVPGSKKGSTENLQQILRVLPHAVETARAHSGTRHLHTKENPRLGMCGCSRPDDEDTSAAQNKTDDLGAAVSQRARKSPYPMIPVQTAQTMVLENIQPLSEKSIRIADVRPGMVLARDVVSVEPVPAYPASVMDGYAVIAADCPGDLRVLGANTAGTTSSSTMQVTSGTAIRVATGAPVPPGADAVIMVEDTKLLEADSSGEEVLVRVTAGIQPGQHIRPIGFDVPKDTVVLEAGAVVSAIGGEVGSMAMSGNAEFQVHGVPKIAVMSTGDEIADNGTDMHLSYGGVRDSNRPALISALRSLNTDVVDLGIVKDDPEVIAQTITNALQTCDGIITTGGVSMGERDWLKPVVEQKLGGKIIFGRVAMKPSKPTTFAVLPGGKFIFGLPGNPASALVAFHMFTVPAIRKLSGQKVGGDSSVCREVVATFYGKEVVLDRVRPEYARGRLTWNAKEEKWAVNLVDAQQQSSRMPSMVGANALISLPKGSQQKSTVCEGELVPVIVIGQPHF
ncbi:hypothetical protein GGI07_001866 [Coemansia sp. Benny D115]|nr:hypothetical protein GGI07_001866 [Coemansia sp. Benny D115]